MVMGRGSRSKGCRFESRHGILDGHFFTYYCCKNCNVCLNKRKKVRGGPIILKVSLFNLFVNFQIINV